MGKQQYFEQGTFTTCKVPVIDLKSYLHTKLYIVEEQSRVKQIFYFY